VVSAGAFLVVSEGYLGLLSVIMSLVARLGLPEKAQGWLSGWITSPGRWARRGREDGRVQGVQIADADPAVGIKVPTPGVRVLSIRHGVAELVK